MMKGFSINSFVAGIMLGALLTGVWFIGGPSVFTTFTPSSSELTTDTERKLPQGSGAISVADQASGDTVVVESVTVPPPGVWVAVREVNGNDLGNVLGAARVGGPRTQVSVPLLRATEPGRAYAIELYRDDGSGEFDPATFSVYVDFETGARAVAYFNTAE